MAAGFSVKDALNKNSKAGIDESPRARFRTKDISIFKMYRKENLALGDSSIPALLFLLSASFTLNPAAICSTSCYYSVSFCFFVSVRSTLISPFAFCEIDALTPPRRFNVTFASPPV